MIRITKYLSALFAATLFFACSSSQKYSNSQYQDKYNTDDAYFSAKDLKKPTPKVKDVDVEKYKSKDNNYFYDSNAEEETANPNAENGWNNQQNNQQYQSSQGNSSSNGINANNTYQNQNPNPNSNSSTVINNYYQNMGRPSWNWGYGSAFSMFNMGFPVGNNMYMSFGYGNPFYSYSPFCNPFYSPFYSPFYNPYSWFNPYGGYGYNPYGGYGYNPYGGYGYNPYYGMYSPWYNPYYGYNDGYYGNGYNYGNSGSSGYTTTDQRVRRSSNFSPVSPTGSNGAVRSSGPVLMQQNPNAGNTNAPVRTQPVTNPNTTITPINGGTATTPDNGNGQYRPGNISDYDNRPVRNDNNRNGGINVNQPDQQPSRPANNNVYQPDNNTYRPQNNNSYQPQNNTPQNNNNSFPSYQGGRSGGDNGGFRTNTPSNNAPARSNGGGGGSGGGAPRRR